MMRWIVESSLKFRLLVIVVAGAIMAVGITQLRGMPTDVLPEFTPPYVEIQTEALGLSAAEVEQLITVPLEGDLLNGVAGIDIIRSESVPGLSSVILVFEQGTDLLDARQLVQERLTQAGALPNVSKPPVMLQPLSAESRVMMIGLSSSELPLIELGLLARWTIRPRLLGVPGVANVVIWGQREHQLQVQVDPERLRDQGISLQQIIRTTGNAQLVSPLTFLEASTPGAGGFIDTPNQRLQVRHILPITQPEGLAEVPVDGVAGGGLRLGDVATVVEDHQPLIGDASVDDGPGLLLVVEKFPGANTLEVTRDVEEALDALRPGLSGVAIDSTIFRPASFIETAIDNLALALLIGGLLLVLVLFAVLLEWRIAMIGLASISLSLVAAALVLFLLGETMNALVLAGLVLAVGVVVDDAIMGVENTWRRLRQQRGERTEESTRATVLEASVELRSPITYATLILLVAVTPVFFLEGTSGAFFEPLALSYALAVLVSMAVALTLTPALGLILLRSAPLDRRDAPLARWLKRDYDAVLSRSFRTPRPVFMVLGVIALLGLSVLARFEYSLLPSFKETELLVRLDGVPGTSRPEMIRVTNQVSSELRALPGVQNVGVHVGRAVLADQVSGINSGQLWVSIDPVADYDDTVGSIREVVDGYPGLERNIATYSSERIRAVGGLADGDELRDGNAVDALTGADKPVVVRIYGRDLETLRSKADEVRQALADVDGVVDARVDPRSEEPIIEVEVDLAAAGRVGIKPGDVRRSAATLVQGIEVGSLFEEQKVFEVIVTGVPATRHSPSSIGELLIDTPGGDRVRLADVADVRIAPAPTVIERESASRRIDVSADVDGRDLGSVVRDVERRLEAVEFPLEYHAEVLSGSRDRQAAGRRIVGFAAAAAIGIFLLLQAAFGSWRLAGLFFLSLPLALTGGVLAAYLGGATISLGTLLGLFAVFGIAVRNGMLIVDRCRRLARDGGDDSRAAIVRRAAEERLMPTLLTASAVWLAVLTLVILGSGPGLEIAHPMAVVILGGLVTSTLFSLLVVPALCLRFAPATEPEPVERVVEQPAGS